MRLIKFRYWNGNKILNQEAIINHLNKYIARNDEHLMQFTGLLDKQGVEIFEGDIMVLNKLKPSYYVVKYKENSFVLDGVSLFENAHYFTEREVVGNVYENSELLEKLNGR